MCKECGRSKPLPYGEFRTGLDFYQVKQMLWVESEDSQDWVYRRRNTVLGHWHMIKKQMYESYLQQWKEFHDNKKKKRKRKVDTIPF